MQIFVYDFKFDPDIERDNRRQVKHYMKLFRPKLEKQIGKFEYWGWMIFATKKLSNTTLIEEVNEKEVKMEVRFTNQC